MFYHFVAYVTSIYVDKIVCSIKNYQNTTGIVSDMIQVYTPAVMLLYLLPLHYSIIQEDFHRDMIQNDIQLTSVDDLQLTFVVISSTLLAID